MADEEREATVDESLGIVTRVLRALEVLLSAHAKLARIEARDDARRIGSALVLLAAGASLVAAAGALAEVAAILVLHARIGGSWATSVGLVAGADVVLAVACFQIGRARLAAPVLPETRAVVSKAVSAIRG